MIPAIDVHEGRLARFTPQGPAPLAAYGGDPMMAAQACVEAGAAWLHVVDMDLAYAGEPRNLHVLRSIVELGAPVQAAGGITTDQEIQAVLEAGAARAILGSGALGDLVVATRLVERYGDRLAVAIEVEDERIRARGRTRIDLPLEESMAAMIGAGVARLVVTAVSRIGSLRGPDLDVVARAVGSGCLVLAAGGIATTQDLIAVRDAGAEGAIVGRAALEGGVDLATAIASLT